MQTAYDLDLYSYVSNLLRMPQDRLIRSACARALVLVGSLSPLSIGCAPEPGLTPAPSGTPAASVASLYAPKGYVESEYFFRGTANSYQAVGTWGTDGHWDKQVSQANLPFVTRLLVERPADAARFNGTVWVEWLNVSGGIDAAIDVIQARDQIIASGAAWVGISAQKVGVDSLRGSLGGRYLPLNISSDALSYDIFAQVARAVREHPDTLGGSPAQRLFAIGDSQSALRLATYVNAWHQQDRVFDGFIIHSRFTSGAPIGDGIMGNVPTRIRDDVSSPVLQLQTEVEVGLNLGSIQAGLGNWADVRQPDSANVHTWEVAGAAHMDRYLLTSMSTNTDPTAVLSFPGCSAPINDFPMHYAANAALLAMERWVTGGQPPASLPPIETVDGLIQRDADGNARGGLRLPDIDVPIAQYNGFDYGTNVLCALGGSSVHFTPDALQARYGNRETYVGAYRSRADAAVSERIMTPADRDAAAAAAASISIP